MPSKPKMKSSQKKDPEPKSHQGGNNKLFQKALDGVKDEKKPRETKANRNQEKTSSSSYVKTNKEGKKIIDLKKGGLKVEEETIPEKREGDNGQNRAKGNVLDRIQRRDKTKGR
jgi:hypothetical protein